MRIPLRPKRRDPAESIRKNSMYGLAARLSGALFTGILTLYLVRALDPSGYGTFALVVSISSVVLLISDFGISQSAARFAAERRGERRSLAAIVGDGMSLKLVVSGITTIALFALSDPIASAYGDDNLTWPLRLISISLLGQSLMALFSSTFEAVGRNAIGFRLAFSESLLETTTSVALVALGTGVTGAALGRTIGLCFGGLLGLYLAIRLLRPERLRVAKRSQWGFGSIFGYAGALFVIGTAYVLYNEVGTLMVGAILGTTAAGVFAAPMRLLTLIHYPALALAAGVGPRLADHPDLPRNVDAFQLAVRMLIIVQLTFVPFLLVWADPIVDLLLGADYEESVIVLQALAPFVFLGGIATLLSLAINYAGAARKRIPVAVGTVVVTVIAGIVLIEEVGVEGASIATDAGSLVYVGGHLWISVQTLGVRMGPLLLTTARCLLAAGAMSAVLLGLGTTGLSGLEAGAGALAAPAAYLAVLLASRELRVEEVRAGARLAGGAVGRLGRGRGA